ncbi:uncharacterized protein LOC116127880 [Pistacia vera]|uniref:uncharacterized protein LOC116127880 n=1 Tax=Pistacia vera TaxID=55513 RepID=UPI001263AFDA|nr:uncharacterized protein LOC116127880 [Pistacia vera]
MKEQSVELIVRENESDTWNNPTVVHVSPPLNGDNNYNTWYKSMRMAWRVKNKLGIVDGTFKTPNPTSQTYKQWVQANDMVMSWLIHLMVPELAQSIIYADTAQAIWEDLRDRFSQPNSSKMYDIKKGISYCLQRDPPATIYYTRLKSLWDDSASYITIPSCLCETANAVNELLQQDHAVQFLQGLNDGYAAFRSQILLREPLPPNVGKVTRLVFLTGRA